MQTTLGRQDSSSVGTQMTVENGVAVPGRNNPLSADARNKTLSAIPRSNGNGNGNGRLLVDTLCKSKLYQDYERAFSEATGQVLALRPVESWQLPHHGKRHENPFCKLMAQKSRACAACLQVIEKLSERAVQQPASMTCAVGMCDTAVPVRLGDRVIGFLQTGQVFRKKPTQAQFERTARLVAEWGVEVGREELKAAYFATPVISHAHHESVVRLLAIFAQHLSILSNQVVV